MMHRQPVYTQQTMEEFLNHAGDRHKAGRSINDQILDVCKSKNAAKGLMLINRHGIDPNASRFGAEKEPLLHALARINRYGSIAELREKADAKVELTNAAGETPLAIALKTRMPFDNVAKIQHIVKVVGGRLDAIATVRMLATHCIRNNAIGDLMQLNNSGMTIDPVQVPLMHLFALHCQNKYAGMYLLDIIGQNPMERDAQGRTLLELPEDVGSTHLRSQIRDAVQNSPKHDLVVMMGIHKQLGAGSLLQSLPVELFRDFILPHAVRHLLIRKVRAARLKALTANEGVTIQWSLEMDYVHMGYGDVTLADFRRAHFLAVTKGLMSNLPKEIKRSKPASREMLTHRLTTSGFLFTEPYTETYAECARAVLKAYVHP